MDGKSYSTSSPILAQHLARSPFGTPAFCLRWNNHGVNLVESLEALVKSNSYVDCTIVVDDCVRFRAHRVVLVANSLYFCKLLQDKPMDESYFIIPGVKAFEMHILLNYMYTGVMNIPQNYLSNVMKVAELLKVKGLNDMHDFKEKAHESSVPRNNDVKREGDVGNDDDDDADRCGGGGVDRPGGSSCRSRTSSEKGDDNEKTSRPKREAEPETETDADGDVDADLADDRAQGPRKSHKKRQKLNSADPPVPPTPPALPSSISASADNQTAFIESETIQCRNSEQRPTAHANDDPTQPGQGTFSQSSQKQEWKRYKQYTNQDIMEAIECVRNGMSALQASRKYNVPSRTLYDKVKKMGITSGRPVRDGSSSRQVADPNVESSAAFPYAQGFGHPDARDTNPQQQQQQQQQQSPLPPSQRHPQFMSYPPQAIWNEEMYRKQMMETRDAVLRDRSRPDNLAAENATDHNDKASIDAHIKWLRKEVSEDDKRTKSESITPSKKQ